MDAALFLNHPAGRPVIGWRHEMGSFRAATRSPSISFYAPNNAVLVVAGGT